MGEMWRGRGGNINLVSFGRMKVLYISQMVGYVHVHVHPDM